MSKKRILYMSGSLGLGHIGRDLAIAAEIRRLAPDVAIDWLAISPADRVVREAGETLLPESEALVDDNAIAERYADGRGSLSLTRYAFGAVREWDGDVEVVGRLTAGGAYDVVVGDETYALATAYKKEPDRMNAPFVMIYDFIGFDPMSWHPVERLGTYLWNWMWSRKPDPSPPHPDLGLFIGEVEDVPDRSFGPLLGNRRAWAEDRCEFVGYVLPFDPKEYGDRTALRRRLDYGPEPLVVCSIGGTAVGRGLLDLCARAYPSAAARIPGLRMVLVAGPRLDPGTVEVPDGVDVRGYVPDLYEHLAASDLAIVQGGGTVTLELTALQRPFLYFPIPGHFEQQVHVAGRLRRHGAGVRMDADISPETLTDAIVENLDARVRYPPIPVDGARVAARHILELMA